MTELERARRRKTDATIVYWGAVISVFNWVVLLLLYSLWAKAHGESGGWIVAIAAVCVGWLVAAFAALRVANNARWKIEKIERAEVAAV